MMATQTTEPTTNGGLGETRYDRSATANQESMAIWRASSQSDAAMLDSAPLSTIFDVGTCVHGDTNHASPVMTARPLFHFPPGGDDAMHVWTSLEASAFWIGPKIPLELTFPHRIGTFSNVLLKLHTEPWEEPVDTGAQLKLEFLNRYVTALVRNGNIDVTWISSPVHDSSNRRFEEPGPAHSEEQATLNDWQAVVREFAKGINDERPSSAVSWTAEKVLQAAISETTDPEFLVDLDGSLSLDLRLDNGLRMLAELTIAGDLDAGFYDDSDENVGAVEVMYLSQATAEELVAHFTQSLCQFQ